MILDSSGYMIGPSINHAAEKKLALISQLDTSSTKDLKDLFNELWQRAA